jgi:hypothetical protein
LPGETALELHAHRGGKELGALHEKDRDAGPGALAALGPGVRDPVPRGTRIPRVAGKRSDRSAAAKKATTTR